jgi:hypothetical protein
MTDTDLALDSPACWPALHLREWQATCDTLHMWTQIVGKIRLALTPLVNHWWNVALYVYPRGLTTSMMPYQGRAFEIRLDFVSHALVVDVGDGTSRAIPLEARSVADFYSALMALLRSSGIDLAIWTTPVEIPDPIRFEDDTIHASYDRDAVGRFGRILTTVDTVFNTFRAGFIGKCSPVHFFWGSFDLCVTRFSGRRAPPRPGADRGSQEAYSHEVSSVGFWPGSADVSDAAFYAYTAPEPAGLRARTVLPAAAAYRASLGEFVLMYEDVRTARSPTDALREFCESTYATGADLAQWDRAALERTASASTANR